MRLIALTCPAVSVPSGSEQLHGAILGRRVERVTAPGRGAVHLSTCAPGAHVPYNLFQRVVLLAVAVIPDDAPGAELSPMKHHPLVAALLVTAACGTEPDSRPVTFEVITYEVLQPNCGSPYCHSSVTNTAQLAFDTLEATRASLRGGRASRIQRVINDKTMPSDSPMDPRDIALFEAWVNAGRPGL